MSDAKLTILYGLEKLKLKFEFQFLEIHRGY